jgi:RimJ/RimL family protein N-acetyltransferase
LSPDDALMAFGLLSDDRVTRTLLWDGPSRLEDLQGAYFATSNLPFGEPPTYPFAVERIGLPGIAGSVSARARLHPRQFDIGYWLGVPYWNLGLMTDAVRLVTGFAFEHLDAVRTYATVFVGNEGSRLVLEKNRFRLDGTLRQHVMKRGEWLDEWFFTLLRSEWEADRSWYRPASEVIRREP